MHTTLSILLALVIGLAAAESAAAQSHSRRLSVEGAYVLRYLAGTIDAEELGFEESADLRPRYAYTGGINYRFSRRMSLYAQYSEGPSVVDPRGMSDLTRVNYTGYVVGFMPMSGFFEFGLGYARVVRRTLWRAPLQEIEYLTEERPLDGVHVRVRLDARLHDLASVYAGVSAIAAKPSPDGSAWEGFAEGSIGMKLYVLAQQKGFVPRKERRARKRAAKRARKQKAR